MHVASDLSFLFLIIAHSFQNQVLIENQLSISKFGAFDDNTDTTYHLCSVLHHWGQSPCSGHYTACSLREQHHRTNISHEQWVHFDDAKTELMDKDDIILQDMKNQQNCYMAVYKLI